MKKILGILLILALLLPLAAAAEDPAVGQGGIMYVYTADGKTLNVRSSPSRGGSLIGHLKFGAQVEVLDFLNSWCRIRYKGGEAYVQSRFLSWYPTGNPNQSPVKNRQKSDKEKLKDEQASEQEVDSFMVRIRATRASGTINMRAEPSKTARKVETMADGTKLEVTGETISWYKVTDPANGKTGYVAKSFAEALPSPAGSDPNLGKLDVNGAFTLQCRLPAGYKLEVMDSLGSKIVAALLPRDNMKPSMTLTVDFDEQYADVDRLNDLDAEKLDALRKSFTSGNDVQLSETSTSHGTRLLVARVADGEEDLVDILSIYKGYVIEFLLQPAPGQKLTDAQISTCVDFLSDLDFVSAE